MSASTAADLPHLRYITQAGGRMPPERVRRFADAGADDRAGDLFVMYGATEATARMAYLPPELASSHPAAIGRPIPGGAFTIEPLDAWADDGVGELVYRGPNVMMGYAHGLADLALGKTVEALHTGDIARRAPRRALRSDRPQQPFRQDVRPADRPPTRRGRPCVTTVWRRTAPTSTTASRSAAAPSRRG